MFLSKWLILGLILLVIEIITPGVFFFACLSIGAFGAALSTLFNVPEWAQWLCFVAISVASIYFIRPFATRFFVTKPKQFNVDALVGKDALVTEKIVPPHTGMVKVSGNLWRAECGSPVQAGDMVEVTGVDGSHLNVKPKNK